MEHGTPRRDEIGNMKYGIGSKKWSMEHEG